MKDQNNNETYVLSPGRVLTEEEKVLSGKPLTHTASEEERRITNEIKRNWHRGEMKIATILLEGDAGSGKRACQGVVRKPQVTLYQSNLFCRYG